MTAPLTPSLDRGFAMVLLPLGLCAVALAFVVPKLRPEPLLAQSAYDRGDTDGDGIPDAQEWALGTSAFLRDSDNDGFSDAEEFARGTSPRDYFDAPGPGTCSELRVGMTARGESGNLVLHLVLYSGTGDFSTSVLRLGVLIGGRVVSVPLERLLPRTQIRDSAAAGTGLVRTLDISINPTTVHAIGAATFFIAIGSQGVVQYQSAAKVDVYSVDNTLLLRRDREVASTQQSPSPGGSLRQPIPAGGIGSIPLTWQAGNICYQRSNVTGVFGAKVVHEVVTADCLAGWDTFCPSDCSASVGGTFESIDPATLIGG